MLKCVYLTEPTVLIDNLLNFPDVRFGIHNTVFFELLFELFNDKRFHSSGFTPNEFDELTQSKNCFEAFIKLMEHYRIKTNPTASILAYRFSEPANFKSLFRSYIIKYPKAKYIHQLKNSGENKVSSANSLSSD